MLINQEMIADRLSINRNTCKTFVFDLDGTIIYDGKPTESKFEQVLRQIQSAGHNIVFCNRAFMA